MTRLVSVVYHQHLNSPEWREKRAQRLALDEHRCFRCRGTDGLEVHHRVYDRLGNERMDDLETLCRRCHKLEHGRDPSLPAQFSNDDLKWRRNGRMAFDAWQETVALAARASAALEELFETAFVDQDGPHIEQIRGNFTALMRQAAHDCYQTWEPRKAA